MASGEISIGIAGTGFIATGLAEFCTNIPDIRLRSVLTRRQINSIESPVLQATHMTNDLDEFLSGVDCIVECSGDPLYGTETAKAAMDNGIPVVTMNAEMQVVAGSWLATQGPISEAEGDQPGSLAAFNNELLEMGFKPLVYGSMKRFLNLRPSPEEMEHWAATKGLSRSQVTSSTDGTKMQIEQALVANGLGATIARPGLLGPECQYLQEGVDRLAMVAMTLGGPISDYVMAPGLPSGIFIAAEHSQGQAGFLRSLKLGSGPYYTLVRPHHLCHLEIPKTIRQVVHEGKILLNNGTAPTLSVAAIAKEALGEGHHIERGLGGFVVRGEAVKIADAPNAVPIGLVRHATILNDIEPGQTINFEDVALPDSLALSAWRATVATATTGGNNT